MLITTDKVAAMEKQTTSPVGKTVAEAAAGRRAQSPAYRKAQDKHAAAAAFAKQVIHLRTQLGITQDELAKRVRTSYSQISRIESGRHEVSAPTMRRVLRALDVQPVFGYRVPARKGHPAREYLIAV